MADYFDLKITLEMVEAGNVFWEAINEGDISKLKSYLESGRFDVNKSDNHGRSALHIASCRGQIDVVTLLLKHGADVMKLDKHGNTPLHWCGHLDVVELLIENGANVFKRNSIGATPREMAERRGINKVVIEAYKNFEKHYKQLASSYKDKTNISYVNDSFFPSLFHEFSRDISNRNLCLLILGILAFSLYLTYTVMNVSSKSLETRIPLYTKHQVIA